MISSFFLVCVLLELTTGVAAEAQSCSSDSTCESVGNHQVLLQHSTRSAQHSQDGDEDVVAETVEDGPTWNKGEALTVMAKLHQVMKSPMNAKSNLERINGEYECHTGFEDTGVAQPCDGKNGNVDGTPAVLDDLPSAAKFVRLGFHDCVKNKDGTGGCDGCFRFHDQFMKYNDLASGDKRQLRRNDPVASSNNGLAMAADVLELIYTTVDFPPHAPKLLGKSLRDRGRTRADLWAFAALVATDYAMAENNKACRGEGVCPHLYNEVNPPFPCEITPTRRLRFYTGRKDCPAWTKPKPVNGFVKTEAFELPRGHRYRAYETTLEDDLPNPSGNSSMLTEYMKRVFNYNKKETVAIMGAHSLGEMHGKVGLFKYEWQRHQTSFLNNNFYRMLAAKPGMFISNCKPWRIAGGPNGALAETGWWVRPIRKSKSAGPYEWFHHYRRCPVCHKDGNGEWVNDETDKGSKKFRQPTCCVCNELPESQVPAECIQELVKDETMLPTDMSLISNFDVDEYGVPGACPGFPKTWNRDNIVEQALGQKNHGIGFYGTEPNCPDNDLRDCPKCRTMASLVRYYADHQNSWADDFYDAWEKMLSNGYRGPASQLTLGPDVLGIGHTECHGTKRRTTHCTLTVKA